MAFFAIRQLNLASRLHVCFRNRSQTSNILCLKQCCTSTVRKGEYDNQIGIGICHGISSIILIILTLTFETQSLPTGVSFISFQRVTQVRVNSLDSFAKKNKTLFTIWCEFHDDFSNLSPADRSCSLIYFSGRIIYSWQNIDAKICCRNRLPMDIRKHLGNNTSRV